MPLARVALITDRNWVRQSFMLSKDNINQTVKDWQTYCSADSKFTSARLGGNFTINNPPQFTRYADPRRKGLLQERYSHENWELGMGHYYSDALDDNMVMTTLRFGVARYNGMFSFFTGFYDNDAAKLANQGLISAAFYNVGRLAGLVFTIRFWPLAVMNAFGVGWRFATGSPASKYYYLEPTMYPYWSRVNFIANTLAVQLGIVPRLQGPFDSTDSATRREKVPDETLQFFNKMDPNIFRREGGIDIYAVSTAAQRMADRRFKNMENRLSAADTPEAVYTQLRAFVMDYQAAGLDAPPTGEKITDPGKASIEKYLQLYHGSAWGDTSRINEVTLEQTLSGDAATVQPDGTAGTAAAEGDNAAIANAAKNFEASSLNGLRPVWNYDYEKEIKPGDPVDMSKALVKPGWLDKVRDQFQAVYRDGGEFVSFRVDNPGTVSESFSNSSRESDISSKLNGMVNSARSARFTFSDGNTGAGLIDEAKNAAGNLLAGFLDGVHMSGLLTLAGAAFVDIPKVYDTSSATFPTASYTIKLRSPYGNKMSRFINLYVPLSMLLAAALPISTGKQSYTGPFLCEAYSRGRVATRLGMISSLSITRGVGNLGWNNDDEPLGIDVSFEVADLSSVMHAPINDRVDSVLPWKGLMDDDSAFGDYMSVLSSMALEDMVYPYNKFMLNLTKKAEFYRAFGTGAQIGSLLGHKFPGRIISIFAANPEVSINR